MRIWGQLKRPLSIGSQSVPQEFSTDNILSALQDYDPIERISPVPVATPVLPVNPITVPGYSLQLFMLSLQRRVYNPMPMSQLASVRSSQSDLIQTVLQFTQIDTSDCSFRSLSESPYTGLPRTTSVSTMPAITTSINSYPTPPSNDIAVV